MHRADRHCWLCALFYAGKHQVHQGKALNYCSHSPEPHQKSAGSLVSHAIWPAPSPPEASRFTSNPAHQIPYYHRFRC